MKNKTERAARKGRPMAEPKPPFPKQHQAAPGLESKLKPRPRYEAEAYKPAGKLQGKIALITGGDSGIGRAVALLYAREGAHVSITYLPEEQSDADAQELIARDIRVNAVAPGPVWTPLNPFDAGTSPEKVARFGASKPMGRPAQPEELAPAYVFPASNADSSHITGTVQQVMGGETTGG